MTFKLITDDKKLKNEVDAVLKAYHSVYDKLHVLTCSVLRYTAISGRADLLTTLYNGLHTNDRSALRGSYIPRIMAAIGGVDFALVNGEQPVIDDEVLKEAMKAGAWLGFGTNPKTKAKEFFVISKKEYDKAPANRRAAVELIETKLLNPQEEQGWRPFFMRNNLAEAKRFGTNELFKAIADAKKKAFGEKANVNAHVDKKAQAIIKKAFDDMEALVAANSVHDERVAEAIKM